MTIDYDMLAALMTGPIIGTNPDRWWRWIADGRLIFTDSHALIDVPAGPAGDVLASLHDDLPTAHLPRLLTSGWRHFRCDVTDVVRVCARARNIGGGPTGRAVLAVDVVFCADLIDGALAPFSGAADVYLGGDFDPIRFSGGDWTVVVMPFRAFEPVPAPLLPLDVTP